MLTSVTYNKIINYIKQLDLNESTLSEGITIILQTLMMHQTHVIQSEIRTVL